MNVREPIDDLYRLLSDDERSQAERHRFERDRRRYVAAHGYLRILAGRYLGVAPREVRFHRDRCGKPTLDKTMNPRALVFNMSESEGMALFAFCRDMDVGIDIERIRAMPPVADIVKRFFSPAEQEEYSALASDQKLQAFFNGWTRKEAVLKAVGCGLLAPTSDFDVSLTPGKPARIERTAPGMGAPGQWGLHHLALGNGFVGAVAARRVPVRRHP